jgi:superfamily II DNA or RNA helicase
MELRSYQERGVTQVATKLAEGKRKIVYQLATGGGKTITFSAISDRYIKKSGKAVLILVHRKELLQQTRRTLYNAYGISAQIIIAGMRHIPPADVYVGMVESVHRRIPMLQNVGLVIIDEAHIAAFNKLHEHFPEQFIIGFTATPISANRKKPMKDFYADIVCGVDIPELISEGHLCQNITYAPKDIVDRSALSIKNGEFDEGLMAVEFSKPKYVKNAVKAYEKWAKGNKTIIFNCTIDHSQQVNNAFVIAGYNSKHLDSTMSATERDNILKWFKNTPDAVLNNVGILTAGFDEPTIETVIMNKSTMSMPLWLQCTGRGARPTEAKSAFTIIDMGGNALAHGDWCDARDWENLFLNPAKPGKGDGVAPVKNCPQCDAILNASMRTCKHCGFEFPAPEVAMEEELSDFVVVTKGIDVRAVIERHRDKKEYYPFFRIGKDLAQQAKNTVPKMNDEIAEFILNKYFEMARQWCGQKGKRFNQWHQVTARNHLYSELQNHFKKWKNPHADAAAA